MVRIRFKHEANPILGRKSRDSRALYAFSRSSRPCYGFKILRLPPPSSRPCMNFVRHDSLCYDERASARVAWLSLSSVAEAR